MTNQIGSVEDNPRWDPSSEVEAIPSPRASARGHEKKGSTNQLAIVLPTLLK